MKTFLKILLLLVTGVFLLKFLRLMLGLGFALFGVLAAMAAAGLGVVAALFAAAIALIVGTAPLWIPILAIVGAITLIKKIGSRTA